MAPSKAASNGKVPSCRGLMPFLVSVIIVLNNATFCTVELTDADFGTVFLRWSEVSLA